MEVSEICSTVRKAHYHIIIKITIIIVIIIMSIKYWKKNKVYTVGYISIGFHVTLSRS